MSGFDEMFAGTKAALANLSIRKECTECGAMVKNLDLHMERLHDTEQDQSNDH